MLLLPHDAVTLPLHFFSFFLTTQPANFLRALYLHAVLEPFEWKSFCFNELTEIPVVLTLYNALTKYKRRCSE